MRLIVFISNNFQRIAIKHSHSIITYLEPNSTNFVVVLFYIIVQAEFRKYVSSQVRQNEFFLAGGAFS